MRRLYSTLPFFSFWGRAAGHSWIVYDYGSGFCVEMMPERDTYTHEPLELTGSHIVNSCTTDELRQDCVGNRKFIF